MDISLDGLILVVYNAVKEKRYVGMAFECFLSSNSAALETKNVQ